ncbi:SH3 domain-containing protein 21 isoform X3 [Myotis lucifugus]|uniref:SH3 domain-containing protein 21 isoform X3 n=1 Tax=Myotis lucifugus TaxID=59463 RepID=UPI000CCC7584|nr:SH3 domain-containing protein 21 isoform X3 [Myotis lucifugus]
MGWALGGPYLSALASSGLAVASRGTERRIRRCFLKPKEESVLFLLCTSRVPGGISASQGKQSTPAVALWALEQPPLPLSSCQGAVPTCRGDPTQSHSSSQPTQPSTRLPAGSLYPPCPALEGVPEAMEVLVLAGYRAQKEGELSLAPGDVVRQVCKGPARGWLRGELGGHCGFFPERLVQEIPETLRGAGEAPRPRCARSRGRPANSRSSPKWCKVNFSYSPEQADELKLQAGEVVEVIKEIEDGWWLGKKNGQLGAFPSNFVELLDSGPPGLDNPGMPSISLDPQQPPKMSSLTCDNPPDYLRTVFYPETYRVLFDYQPEAPDELPLRKGDEVKVLRKTTEDEGWWEGESQGRRGVFPDNFVLPPPPIKKLLPRKVVLQDSAPVKESKKMMPKTTLPTVKKLMTAHTGPSKAKKCCAFLMGICCRPPGGDGQKRPSRDSGSSGSLLAGGPGHTGRKRSRTQATRQRPANTQEEERRSRAKAPPANKTATPGKTLTPKKTLPPRKARTPEGVFSADEAPALGVELADEALYSKMASSGDEAATLEKALTFDQMLSEETSSGDNTQVDPSPEAAPPKSKSMSSSVHKPEEHPLDKRDSSDLQLEATPGSLENVVQLWPDPTAFQEKTPVKDETTPKEEAAHKNVAPAQKNPPPIKPTPGPQGTPTLHSLVPQNPTVSKNDKEEVRKLQEEVESLRKALELMGEQLESKLMDIWEELKRERERRRLLEVQMNLRIKESLTPSSSPTQQQQTQTQ